MSAGELNTAEVAFAGCEEVDKLQYMLYIKQLPTRETRLAELALYRRSVAEAEALLLQVAVMLFRRYLSSPLASLTACFPGATVVQFVWASNISQQTAPALCYCAVLCNIRLKPAWRRLLCWALCVKGCTLFCGCSAC